MKVKQAVVIGAGLGGLAASLELRRRGFDVTILERHNEVGGKASSRRADGFRWDEGPSIVVMPWVYRELFESSGLDLDAYLTLRQLDPSFRIILTDGRVVDLPADVQALRDVFATIEPRDAEGLDRFLALTDRFAAMLGHAYCDRLLESWSQVMFSPLMTSAAIVSPFQKYTDEVDRHFQSPAIREMLYGFPTYSGFRPDQAPASFVIVPWTILREGVWYPVGGIAAIPLAVANACRDRGVAIHTDVEVEAIELDGDGRVRGVATSSGFISTKTVISNSDYVHTYRMLRGGRAFPPPIAALRDGRAEPSMTYLTIQLGCSRSWETLAHHLLVLSPGMGRTFDEIFERGEYPSDQALYVNTTSRTDPDDAVPGGSNPFVVLSVPPLRPGDDNEDARVSPYVEATLARLEAVGLSGLSSAIVSKHVTAPRDWQRRFHAFRGSIYGLGISHNVLNGAFRPLNYEAAVPGLYFAGGGVQPGAGLPMVVQSGKITAGLVERDWRRGRLS